MPHNGTLGIKRERRAGRARQRRDNEKASWAAERMIPEDVS
jgi:hypothetical protein